MLTKDCRAALRKAGRETTGEIAYDALTSTLKWTPDRTHRVCNHLVSEGYANEFRKQYTSGIGKTHGIILTEQGRHWMKHRLSLACEFVAESVMLPILVSVITTLITMWLKEFF